MAEVSPSVLLTPMSVVGVALIVTVLWLLPGTSSVTAGLLLASARVAVLAMSPDAPGSVDTKARRVLELPARSRSGAATTSPLPLARVMPAGQLSGV